MKSPCFLALLLVFVCSPCVTPALAVGDEWRLVNSAELTLKTGVVEKDADAEVLFWEVRIDDSSVEELVLKNYVRIKVFSDRGKESQSKVDLPYVGSARIKDIAARVISQMEQSLSLRSRTSSSAPSSSQWAKS